MTVTAFLLLTAFLTTATPPEEAAARFRALYEEEWAFRLREYPTLATSVGDHRFDDRLTSVRGQDLEQRQRFRKDLRSRLASIDRRALPPEDRVDYDIFRRQLDIAIEDHETGAHLLPVNSDWGFHITLARLPRNHPFRSLDDYENYLARLDQVADVVDQNIALMRRGMETGMVQPQVVLEGREASISVHVVDVPDDSVFFAPLEAFPPAVPEGERPRLAARARALIADEVVPAYVRFLAFFTGEYRPAARSTIAARDLPDGERFYRGQVRRFTTLDLSPEDVHRLGRAEVTRIRSEMQAIIDQLQFDGGFSGFLEHLRTDPRFYARSPRELLAEASYVAKKIDGRLPALFSRLPRQPYGIEPVPAELAPFFTGGRYVPAGGNARRGGLYWVNTHDLSSRPLYTLPALTLHEAVPGHHLQHALAAERRDLPPFRRHDYVSAYGEGWALYSEWLGVEAGIYETPYEHFGRLTYEMWRACRLVVDTGIHAMGWSRERARAFLAENTALSRHEIETEVDRYISWPGQALAYKLGELKIRELRKRAEESLEGGFDLRAFHDHVLSLGSVPLDVLEAETVRWITARAG